MKRSLIIFVLLLLTTAVGFAQVPASAILERLGYPPTARLLIIHADDMGMSHSVNRATMEALEKGWITSASIMVPCPWFPEAAEFARTHPEVDLGLHLTLTSEWKTYRWKPVSDKPVPSLIDEHGYLRHSDTVLAAYANPVEVDMEIRAQIDKARAAGVQFTHVDSHMGALFRTPQLFSVYQQAAHDYGVPNLLAPSGSPHGRKGDEAAPYALIITKDLQIHPGIPRKVWLRDYKHMLRSLGPGVYELIVHLGYDDAELQGITGVHAPWGSRWRQDDLEVVRSGEFRNFLREQGFVLVSWKDLARALTPPAPKADSARAGN